MRLADRLRTAARGSSASVEVCQLMEDAADALDGAVVSEEMKFAAWKVLFDGNAVNIIQPSELVGKAIEAALKAV